jgi:outer membrane protein OmpA-like peptidoglycan-associated protein
MTKKAGLRASRWGLALMLAVGSMLPGETSRAGDLQAPKGPWQIPGEIQVPKGPWQKPGEIQVPKGIQAIKREDVGCQHHLNVGADALFAFNKSDLNPGAEETLSALGPEITRLGEHPASIEGHTDSIGAADYNQRLSEQRAESVKAWLVSHKVLPESTPVKGYGKTRPVAPNTNPDGSDNPQGRQKNRRVEVVVDGCH